MARVVEDPPQDPGVVDRRSPLVDRVDGFLIGQGLALAWLAPDLAGAAARRAAIVDRLADRAIDVVVPVPDEASHAAALVAILPRLALQSRELADFTLLGGLAVQYGFAAGPDPMRAGAMLAEIERLCRVYDVPAFELGRLVVPSGATDAGTVLAPSLAWLRALVAYLPLETDTAFVVLPPGAAFLDAYRAFIRPTLEHCGYRACRAWPRLVAEEPALLDLACLAHAGLCWADVSGLDDRVASLVGIAHALEVPCVLMAREDLAGGLPATIGSDAVVRYDPGDAEWPAGAVLLMAACLAAIGLAAERGELLRLTADTIPGVFDTMSEALGRMFVPRVRS
jgi:hypothetical protein